VRIVLTAQGTRGDVQPFLLLGAELQRRGHDVLLVGPPSFADRAARSKVPFAPMGADYEEYYGRQAIGSRMDATAFGATRRALDALEQEAFDKLPGLVEGADLVLATGVASASRSAAETTGAQYRFMAQCVRLVPSDHHAPVFVTANGWPRMLNRIAWKPFTGVARPGDAWNTRRAVLGLAPVERGYAHMLGFPEAPILASDADLEPLPPDLAGLVTQTCAIQPTAKQALAPDVEEFLAKGEAPVYIGFGSLPRSTDPTFLDDLVDGLGARGLRAIIAGAEDAPRLRDRGARVLQVGDVPHPSLFPRLAAVVHHGGAGVTQAAARAGVPQVVIPFMLDQHYWAWRVSETGVGCALPRPKVTSRRLGDVVERTAGSSDVRSRAARMAASLRDRDGAVETADAVIASLGASGVRR
jgi:vancomycin aglycone glucosyltransferase